MLSTVHTEQLFHRHLGVHTELSGFVTSGRVGATPALKHLNDFSSCMQELPISVNATLCDAGVL